MLEMLPVNTGDCNNVTWLLKHHNNIFHEPSRRLPSRRSRYICCRLGVLQSSCGAETKFSSVNVNLRWALYKMIIMQMIEEFKYDEQLGKLLRQQGDQERDIYLNALREMKHWELESSHWHMGFGLLLSLSLAVSLHTCSTSTRTNTPYSLRQRWRLL